VLLTFRTDKQSERSRLSSNVAPVTLSVWGKTDRDEVAH